jgi:hypothetical protein
VTDGPRGKVRVGDLRPALELEKARVAIPRDLLEGTGARTIQIIREALESPSAKFRLGVPVPPDFSLKAEMVSGWRSQLAAPTAQLQKSIAAQMTNAITDSNLKSLVFDARPLFLETLSAIQNAGRVALAGQPTSASVLAQLQGSLGQIVNNLDQTVGRASLLAVQSFSDEMANTIKRNRAYRHALVELGWWFPPSLPVSWFVQAGKFATAGDRVGLRRYMNQIAASDAFGQVVDDEWMQLPVFERRRRFFRDGLDDHVKRRYRVSIPSLLPHLEGIAIDAFEPGSKATSPAKPTAAAMVNADFVTGDALVEAVTVLWTYQGFDVVRPTDRRLNRHLILHGRSTGWGSEANSTKLLFTFDLLATVVRRIAEGPREDQSDANE